MIKVALAVTLTCATMLLTLTYAGMALFGMVDGPAAMAHDSCITANCGSTTTDCTEHCLGAFPPSSAPILFSAAAPTLSLAFACLAATLLAGLLPARLVAATSRWRDRIPIIRLHLSLTGIALRE